MDVVAGLEGGDQPRIGGQVGDAAQLDLVVVGHQQAAALGGDEGGAEHPAPLGPDRDVVQVGGVGAEPAGPGHGLVEGGPDAVAGPHFGQQTLAVGGPQLLQLPIVEKVLDHRMGPPEPLQRLGVGGEAGLGPLQRGEPQLVEQHLPELLGGVDVELPASGGDHRSPHRIGLGGQLVADAGQRVGVDADADLLHAGQHPHQGGFDGVMQVGQPLGGQGLPQRRGQPVHRQRGPTGLHGRGDGRTVGAVGFEVQAELALGRIRTRQLQAGEAGQHVGQVVAVAGRVEQVGGQHGVEAQVRRVDAPVDQLAPERLGPVHGHRRAAGAEHLGQSRSHLAAIAIAAAGQEAAGHETGPARGGVDDEGEPHIDPARGGQGQQVAGSAGRGPHPGRGLRRGVEHLHGRLQNRGRGRFGVAQHLGQPVVQRAELQEVEELAHRLAVDVADGQIGQRSPQGHVAHQGHHLGVGADLVLGLAQVLAELGGQGVEVGENAVEAAVLVDQPGRGLVAHPAHAGQVVAGVAPQGGVLHVAGRGHAGALGDAGLVVERVLRNPPLVVEDLDVGVLHELVGVPVAGDDDHVVARIPALSGQGGDDVVGLVAGGLQGG